MYQIKACIALIGLENYIAFNNQWFFNYKRLSWWLIMKRYMTKLYSGNWVISAETTPWTTQRLNFSLHSNGKRWLRLNSGFQCKSHILNMFPSILSASALVDLLCALVFNTTACWKHSTCCLIIILFHLLVVRVCAFCRVH